MGSKPLGNSRWGHADMGGNVWEFVVDWFGPYQTPCVNCANLTPSGHHTVRGGSYKTRNYTLYSTSQASDDFTSGYSSFGMRCARNP